MSPIKVLLTGAAGQIGYSISAMIARGDMFGSNEELILHLFDIPSMISSLEGLKMELQDSLFPLLRGIVATVDAEVAFDQIDAAIMVGSFPRKEGMERKDLLYENSKIFRQQGMYLDKYAKRTVKVLVVGNPANTNALVMMRSAKSIPKENFSAMTRLDHNRAQAYIADYLKISCGAVKNCIVWGNHSNTQFVDVSHALATIDGKEVGVYDAIKDINWLKTEFLYIIQNRGHAVIKARKLSSAVSAAKAACDHMRDWWIGTKPGEWTSMSVCSDGSYGAPHGLFFSFPVKIENKEWSIVQNLSFDDWAKEKFNLTANELQEEADSVTVDCSK